MRVGLFLGVCAVVLALTPAAAASVFGDLPGMEIAERATKGEVAKFEGGETTHQFERSGTSSGTSSASSAGGSSGSTRGSSSSEADGEAFVADLPGGSNAFIADPTSTRAPSTLPAIALAALVVVCFTRFLFRLNHVH